MIRSSDHVTRPFASGVNVIGMPFGEHGLGQELRDKVASLDAAGVPLTVLEMNYSSLKNARGDRELAGRLGDTPVYGVNLICLNLPMFRLALRDYPQVFAGRRNILLPFWEFDTLPAHHIETLRQAEEIWVPNTFLQQVIQQYTAQPVLKMPLHVRVPGDVTGDGLRRKLGIDQAEFVFLCMFDCNSLIPRKDPEAAILAFVSAFGEDVARKVRLILKYKMEPSPSLRIEDVHRLEQLAAKDERILLWNENLPRCETLNLIQACDAYVSPHRAEGLGRVIIEAMLLGKPVIATNYSGITDFLSPHDSVPLPFVKIPVGADAIGDIADHFEWALADPAALTEALRQLADDPAEARRKGAAARARLTELGGIAAFGAAAEARLAELKEASAGRYQDRDQPLDVRLKPADGQSEAEAAESPQDHMLRYQWAADQLSRLVPSQGDTTNGADLFCGNGDGARILSRLGRVWAVEGSERAIRTAKAHGASSRVIFEVKQFPFELETGRFDFIVCLDGIARLDDARGCAQQMIDALKQWGFLAVSMPNEDCLKFDPRQHQFHLRHFRTTETVELFRSLHTTCVAFAGQNIYETWGGRQLPNRLPDDQHRPVEATAGQYNLFVFQKRPAPIAPQPADGRRRRPRAWRRLLPRFLRKCH